MCFGPTSQNRFLYKDLVKKHFEDVEKVEQVADTRQCFLPWNEHAKKLAQTTSTGRFFLLVPPQKVLSVEDGKIPTKKVKVRVKT